MSSSLVMMCGGKIKHDQFDAFKNTVWYSQGYCFASLWIQWYTVAIKKVAE